MIKYRIEALEQLVKLQALSYLNPYSKLYKDCATKQLINRYKAELKTLKHKSLETQTLNQKENK